MQSPTGAAFSLDTTGREFAVWMQLEDTCPLGITTYCTIGALKDITLGRPAR